jgi:phage terminase large subunit
MIVNKNFGELSVAMAARENGKQKYDTFVMKGSARSAKTVTILQHLDLQLGQSARHRKASIVSQSFPHLRDGAMYEFTKHLAREGYTWPHNQGLHEYTIFKSTLNYFSLDKDGNKAVGPGRDILYVNEPNRGIAYESYDQLKVRTAELTILDYNPSGEFWLHTEGILDNPRTKLIHSVWWDNHRNLSEAQIEYFFHKKRLSYLSDYGHFWWLVYGLGEDGILVDDRVMPFLKKASKVPDEAYEIPSGLDFGFNPAPTAFVRMWVMDNGTERPRLYIKPVVYDIKLSINAKGGAQNLVDVLEQKEVSKRHLIIADCEDTRAIEDMRKAGFNIVAINKTAVETSVRLFHDYDIYIVVDTFRGDKIYKAFDTYRFKKDKKTNKIMEVIEDGQDDHEIDAARYVLMCEGKRWRNPVKNKPAA